MTNRDEYSPLVDITETSKPPLDKNGLAWICFCILGVGLLFPFNCYVAASDYFSDLYGDSYSFLMSLAYNYIQWLLLFVSIFVMPRFSFKSRTIIFLLAGSLILFYMPFNHMIFGGNEKVSMGISLLCTFASGCLASLLFGTVLGLVALFPGEYTGAVMSGNGVAGMIAMALQIITKVSVPATAHGNQESGLIFFFLAGGVLIICLLCFLVLLQLPITKYYLANFEASKLKEQGSVNGIETGDANGGNPKKSARQWVGELLTILKKVWREALVVFTVFFTTLSIFPGLTQLIQTSNEHQLSSDWFIIVFFSIFMVGDFIGRTIPKWFIIFTPSNLWIPTFLRLAFFPLFALCIKPLVFNNNAWYFVFMFIFSISNGYCGTLAMIFGPTKAEEHEKEYAGIIMSFFLNFGIWVSTHFAFLLSYLVTGSTGINF
ncbi:hypothetical protein ACTFIU_000840 [Dictyostelium citrinum]